jgi:hypothetical protein
MTSARPLRLTAHRLLVVALTLSLFLTGCAQAEGASTPVDAATEFLEALAADDVPAVRTVANGRWTERSVQVERERLLGLEGAIEIEGIEVFDVVDDTPDEVLIGVFVHMPAPAAKREVSVYVRPTASGAWAVAGASTPVLEEPVRMFK